MTCAMASRITELVLDCRDPAALAASTSARAR